MKTYPAIFLFLLLLLSGCGDDREQNQGATAQKDEASPPVTVEFTGCSTCHPGTRLDPNHDFACVDCHGGNDEGRDEETAHDALIARPGHPDHMEKTCGRCHAEEVTECRTSLHFTLRNKISLIRNHFAGPDKEAALTDIAPADAPLSPLELVDDMLRRRCLRCHPFSPGDSYARTQRGTGCAACHMGFSNGRLLSHEMISTPGDLQCLSCHYANFVGADYYGRYEHDLTPEYRTPFTTSEEFIRPYGVEYHELAPDIHRQRGLSCVDCHLEHRTQEKGEQITCRSCHQAQNAAAAGLVVPGLRRSADGVFLTARSSGDVHPVPQMNDPAHDRYGDRVDCQVCHARWSYNDTTTHLLRTDSDDLDEWSDLAVQSSSWVEQALETGLFPAGEEEGPVMPDTVSGRLVPGIWIKGFTERRWERMIIQRDGEGKIRVFRPILDLRLSYVDRNEEVIFDNLRGRDTGLLPYTPHTTGRAGAFYLVRFAHLLENRETVTREP
ncbi:MAG: hypothetical protein Kow0089_03490 [Desulfobulbaceae bacterium]